MKFKLTFILFSLTLFLFLLILIFLPVFFLGSSYSLSYWRTNWPLLFIWVCLFSGFIVFYFTNKQLFLLLEKEDWPALVIYLEDRVIKKGRYSSRLVRLLASSYLILSDTAAVISLENKTAIARPALVNANALLFGTAYILGKDVAGAVRFFQTRKYTVKKKQRDWVCWYLGFSFLLDYKFQDAINEFSVLAGKSKDPVVTALSSFFLSETMARVLPGEEEELKKISQEGRERVSLVMPKLENWQKRISALSREIHVVIISKYIDGTGRWLYGVDG